MEHLFILAHAHVYAEIGYIWHCHFEGVHMSMLIVLVMMRVLILAECHDVRGPA